MRFEIHVVGGGDHFGVHGTLEVRNFLGALVDEHHDGFHIRMVRGNGVANLLKNGRLARTGGRNNHAASTFTDWGYEINNARFNAVGLGLEIEFFKRIAGGEVFKSRAFGVFLKRHFVHGVNLLELRAVPLVWRHESALNVTAFTEVVTPDSIRRHKDVGGLRLESVARGTQKAKAFVRDFQVATTFFGPLGFIVVSHNKKLVCASETKQDGLNRDNRTGIPFAD